MKDLCTLNGFFARYSPESEEVSPELLDRVEQVAVCGNHMVALRLPTQHVRVTVTDVVAGERQLDHLDRNYPDSLRGIQLTSSDG